MKHNDRHTENYNKKCIEIDSIKPEFKDLTTELICPICFNLVYDPICCKKCHIPFGRSCLEKWFHNDVKL